MSSGGTTSGGGAQRRPGVAAVASASADSLLSVPPMPSEWQEQPRLLQSMLRALLAEPDHAHVALISVSCAARAARAARAPA